MTPAVERPIALDGHRRRRPVQRAGGVPRRGLQPGARVGTVDRFQGQEAAVSIFSMATSSVEDLPRNLEFLFSLNRLNVAVSRARGSLRARLLAGTASRSLPHARADASRQRALPLRGDGRPVERCSGGGRYAPGMTTESLRERLVQSLEAAQTRGGRYSSRSATTRRRLEKASWTVKDNVAHLSVWREHAVRNARCRSDGKPSTKARRTTSDLDAQNAEIYEAHRNDPAATVRAATTASYAALDELPSGRAVKTICSVSGPTTAALSG